MFIRIVPLGILREKIAETLCSSLSNAFNAKCKLLNGIPVPQESFNQWRKQYDIGAILNKVGSDPSVTFIDKNLPTLLLTEEDLYYNGMNFIFGIEEQERGICILSLARLKPEFYGHKANSMMLNERAEKEAIHSIGHYFGLNHCRYTWCVMYPTASVDDIDRKQKHFCKTCELKLSMQGLNLSD